LIERTKAADTGGCYSHFTRAKGLYFFALTDWRRALRCWAHWQHCSRAATVGPQKSTSQPGYRVNLWPKANREGFSATGGVWNQAEAIIAIPKKKWAGIAGRDGARRQSASGNQ